VQVLFRNRIVQQRIAWSYGYGAAAPLVSYPLGSLGSLEYSHSFHSRKGFPTLPLLAALCTYNSSRLESFVPPKKTRKVRAKVVEQVQEICCFGQRISPFGLDLLGICRCMSVGEVYTAVTSVAKCFIKGFPYGDHP
jgi:hypothetical protein